MRATQCRRIATVSAQGQRTVKPTMIQKVQGMRIAKAWLTIVKRGVARKGVPVQFVIVCGQLPMAERSPSAVTKNRSASASSSSYSNSSPHFRSPENKVNFTTLAGQTFHTIIWPAARLELWNLYWLGYSRFIHSSGTETTSRDWRAVFTLSPWL